MALKWLLIAENNVAKETILHLPFQLLRWLLAIKSFLLKHDESLKLDPTKNITAISYIFFWSIVVKMAEQMQIVKLENACQ